MDLRQLPCGDCRFETHPGHGCVSRTSVVCCQGDLCEGRTLVQTSPTDCVFLNGCDDETSKMKRRKGARVVRT